MRLRNEQKDPAQDLYPAQDRYPAQDLCRTFSLCSICTSFFRKKIPPERTVSTVRSESKTDTAFVLVLFYPSSVSENTASDDPRRQRGMVKDHVRGCARGQRTGQIMNQRTADRHLLQDVLFSDTQILKNCLHLPQGNLHIFSHTILP